ncbi:ACP receptor 3 [Caerostris darwini]|uniref:ACP receptor 3 n=1 Tax=Caerostris darwini TaxID=1538125 RepID=A0AAV4X1Q2_9ARAC|nr:ACP receptor 3 [Caerostris darwini]
MIPLEIAWRISVRWQIGNAVCAILLFVRVFAYNLSSAVLVCISLDRYFAIVHSLDAIGAQKKGKVLLGTAWTTSIISSIFQNNYHVQFGQRLEDGALESLKEDISIIIHINRTATRKSASQQQLKCFSKSVLFYRDLPQIIQCENLNLFPMDNHNVINILFYVLTIYGIPSAVIILCYSRILCVVSRRPKGADAVLPCITDEMREYLFMLNPKVLALHEVHAKDFSLNRTVGANYTHFDDEVAAVHMALTEIANREEQNSVIFINSQVTIRDISSVMPSKNSYVLECQLFIDSLKEGGSNVILQWITSHCGIEGSFVLSDISKETPHRRRCLRPSEISHMEGARARICRITIIIMLTFFFCWTPYVVMILWYIFDPASAEEVNSQLQSPFFIFAVSNSCISPLFYGNDIVKFREIFMKLFERNRPFPKWSSDIAKEVVQTADTTQKVDAVIRSTEL